MWTPCPFTFDQAVVQSHQDLTPIVVILFDESDESVNVIRTLNEDTELSKVLGSCLVFVAHNRSPCVSQMLERVGEDPRPLSGAHVLILQQVGVTRRQVIAAWLSGDKLTAEEVIRHATVNLHHVKAISSQRQQLEDTRELRQQQDAALQASETADAQKEVLASPVAVTPPAAGHATAAVAEIEAVGFAVSEYTVSEYNSFLQTQQHHISVKVVKPSGNIIILTVDNSRCVESILTAQERDAGVVVRMFSGENVSVRVPPSAIFRDIAGHDKQVLLRLENN